MPSDYICQIWHHASEPRQGCPFWGLEQRGPVGGPGVWRSPLTGPGKRKAMASNAAVPELAKTPKGGADDLGSSTKCAIFAAVLVQFQTAVDTASRLRVVVSSTLASERTKAFVMTRI